MLSTGYVVVNRVFGIRSPWRDLFEVGIISTTLNSLLAFSGAVGHSLRLAFVKGQGATSGAVLAASIFHSYLNYIMMLGMMATGVIWLLVTHTFYTGQTISLGILTAGVLFATVTSTAIIFIAKLRAWVFRFIGKLWHFFTHRDATNFINDFNDSLNRGMTALRGHRSNLTVLLLSMAAYWVFAALAVMFCFLAFGVRTSPGVLLSGFGIGVSAGNLSLIPGGLAVQEAGIAGVYALFRIPLAQAVLAAILFRVVYDFVPFLLSLVLYVRHVRQSDKNAD
jgi:uncharacterized protein (TIRG00374 family)